MHHLNTTMLPTQSSFPQNLMNAFAAALFFDTRRTLNRTVFERGRHWPERSSVSGEQGHHQLAASREFTDSHGVTLLHTESGRAVGGKVLVTFLVPAVFGDAKGMSVLESGRRLHARGDRQTGIDELTSAGIPDG